MIGDSQWIKRVSYLCEQFGDDSPLHRQMIQIAAQTMARRKENPCREIGYIFYHGLRVTKLSAQLARSLEIEVDPPEVLFAGALFHDVGKGFARHPEIGSGLVKELLKDLLAKELLDRVARIVLLHNDRGRGNLPDEILIVQDADILDHYGTQGVWLKFQYSAHRNENVHDVMDFWHSGPCTSLVEQSRMELNFDLSRRIFEQRLSFQDEFARVFEGEILGQADSIENIREKL